MPSRLLPRAVFIASPLLLCSGAGAQPQPEQARPEVPEAERLLEDVQRLRSAYRALEEEEGKLEGKERAVVALQMRKHLFDFMRRVDELVDKVVRQRAEGVKRPTGIRRTRTLLLEMDRRMPKSIDALEAEAAELRTAISEAPDESRRDLEIGVHAVGRWLDRRGPPLLAGLGIAGFIVGFALQDTLGNFASGAMILMYHPFDVGDVAKSAWRQEELS